jgi:hypothetical protein
VPFAGRSHLAWIAALGVWIVLVFVIVARATGASRRDQLRALAGGLVAGAVNVATDSAASAAGFWRYPEATTPFGPLLYYLEAGLGCGALALIARWLHDRAGRRAVIAFVAALAVYAPIRDWTTAETTHLIVFDYRPWIAVVLADSLSSLVIPVLVAYAVVSFRRG